ncbi:MAG: DUF1295 domain-containing protein [Lachnospiraceae bacterium]|nr:DUF1295 domain-containing protein [Lachnospiraceae bacterium]
MNVKDTKANGILIITVVYLLAGVAGVVVARTLPYDYWLNILIADVVATVLVFVFSVIFDNASVYDPYWSVLPPVAVALFSLGKPLTQLNILHIGVITIWGIRLTGNWAYTFKGLGSQDWRYTMLKEKTGRLYPAVNFLGIHLVPTLIVYMCILPALFAIEHQLDGGLISYLFVLVSLGAVILQGTADYQMHTFLKEHRGELIRVGLWKNSRHPNYLGEILMWWGVGLSVLFSMQGNLWIIGGAVVNTLLFVFVSIPMADERQSHKAGFEEYKKETRMLFPIKSLLNKQ